MKISLGRRLGLKKRHIALIITMVSLLIIFVLLNAVSNNLTSAQTSQQAAKRWQSADSDIRFTQISAFLASEASFNKMSVFALRDAIDSALREATIESVSGSSLWYDAYSTEGRIEVKNGKSTATVNVTAVGGYFFRLHELKYISGFSFSPDDLMQDRVVIDAETAWQLYGSSEVAGQYLFISDRQFVVAGVFEKETGDLFSKAYGERPRIFMSYDAYSEIYPSAVISCWEAVIPNPITGWAEATVEKSISASESDVEIIDNGGRYSFLPLLDTLSKIAVRSMKVSRIIYPFWENVAGVIEDYASLLLLGILISGGIPLICAIVFVVIYIIKHPLTKEQLANKWYDAKVSLSKKAKPKKNNGDEYPAKHKKTRKAIRKPKKE